MWFLQCALSVLLFINCVNSQNTYSIPPQKIIVTQKGFRISIPDESGIEIFFFHGNINNKVNFLDPNVVILSATEAINGQWSLEHKKKGFKAGDFINYWVHIRKDGVGYTSRSILYQIKNVLPDYSPSSRHLTFTNQDVSSTTSGPLSDDEVIDIFGSNRLLDKNTVTTPKSIPTSTFPYQWVWPND